MLRSQVTDLWHNLSVLHNVIAFYLYSIFSQLSNSVIFVKGKGLTNVKMNVEIKVFQKVKFNYKSTKYEVSVVG